MKCKDPCPGSCAANAVCQVISHAPTCHCQQGYVGNPFTLCQIQQGTVLYHFFFFLNIYFKPIGKYVLN